MQPRESEFDAEIRGHLAISIQERVDRGEDPQAARLAALREFGNVTLTRESLRDIWRPRWLERLDVLRQDVRIALRSLGRARGLAATVVVTLALGIGANAAIFSVVREVLLRPLVNENADRLVYIRQSAPGLGGLNATFSVPEIDDLRSKVKTIASFGDFSTIDFPVVGLGEPRVVKAGVVGGSYFGVMGLHAAAGRLLDARDDGPDAAGAAVLTHRFWTGALKADPGIVGKTIRLGSRSAKVVGILEPAVPYPVETEIIANVVTSPHHLEATMVTGRTHRMTDLFGRLAPGVTLEQTRQELTEVHAGMKREHPESYSTAANMQVTVTPLREQITAPARSILLLLLAGAGLVFAIGCSNVANLILARTVRRERELIVRAALGAGTAALRRTLFVESFLLCAGGAIIGVLIARPLVGVIAGYASRFSARALTVTVDSTVLWVCASLAVIASVALAFVPRLPATNANVAGGPKSRGVRIVPGTNRRLRVFAIAQIGLSFVLLAGAGALLASLYSLQQAKAGFDTHRVLAVDLPMPLEALGAGQMQLINEVAGRIQTLPGVKRAATGNFVPWRDAGSLGPGFQFEVESISPAPAASRPHGRLRIVGPGFFETLGVPMIAGRDFNAQDRRGSDLVVIVSRSVADLFPAGDALNHHLQWIDPYFGKPQPRRIVGIVPDVDDERLVAQPSLTVYHPVGQLPFANRLFVQADGDPYMLVPDVMSIIHSISAEQLVERAATLEDVRVEVLGPERLNAFVISGFAAVALVIAVVGVAGVLAFSVSARTREFGVRLAAGTTPSRLLYSVLKEGIRLVGAGIAAGAVAGYVVAVAGSRYFHVPVPAALPWLMLSSAAILLAAAAGASLLPAARASRVDVVKALRTE